VKDAIVALQRVTNSRRIDARRVERSGVPLGLVATGVLYQVVERGPARARVLADQCRMQPAALSRQLGILEAHRYIERAPDPADGRCTLIRATAEGKAAHVRIQVADDQLFAAQLAGWRDREIVLLADLLERLVVDLRAPPPQGTRAASAASPGGRPASRPASPAARPAAGERTGR
jgi:DNA-binding MarR family transcriptional regulator